MTTVLSMSKRLAEKAAVPMPSKRRLSKVLWERVWSIQFVSPLTQPLLILDSAERWSTDDIQLSFRLRTPSRINVVLQMKDLSDDVVSQFSFDLFQKLETEYGAIGRIDDKAPTLARGPG